MFTNEEAGKEIDSFVKRHHLNLQVFRNASGVGVGIELTGDDRRLNEFFRPYLLDDASRGVFNFERYPEKLVGPDHPNNL